MFADPQTVTLGGTPYTLLRVGTGLDEGRFKTADGLVGMQIAHAYGKRTRRQIRLDWKVLAADVMDSSLNVPYSLSTYLVVDAPNVGLSLTTQQNIVKGFTAFLVASSDAKTVQFLNGEA